MKNHCENRADVFDGLAVEQCPELAADFEELSTDYKKWETVYRCRVCGQLWVEKYEARGHGEVPVIKKVL